MSSCKNYSSILPFSNGKLSQYKCAIEPAGTFGDTNGKPFVQLVWTDNRNNVFHPSDPDKRWYYVPCSTIPAKGLGDPCHCVGDPINITNGNEFREETDFSQRHLQFHRFYNSNGAASSGSTGVHWTHSFDRSVSLIASSNMPDGSTNHAVVARPEGKKIAFLMTSGLWLPDSDVGSTLLEIKGADGVRTGWIYKDAATQEQEYYDASGKLLSIHFLDSIELDLHYSDATTPIDIAPVAGLLIEVIDSTGRSLQLTYTSAKDLATLTTPDGASVAYTHDTSGRLTGISYPDANGVGYLYNEADLNGGTSRAYLLTGITDQSGARLVTLSYDNQGRATSSKLAADVDLTKVTYGSDYSTVTYPSGAATRVSLQTSVFLQKIAGADSPCGASCDFSAQSISYDENGYPVGRTDFKGISSTTLYDPNGLLTEQVEGTGTPQQRTTNTTWNTTLRVPLARTVLNASGNTVAKTSWFYNTIGQPLARCEIDPAIAAAASYTCANTGPVPAGVRRWTYSYCTAVDGTQCPIVGLLLTMNGSRTDLIQTTTYSYYLINSATGCGTPGSACHQAGDLYQIKDALGHLTSYTSYDGAGRVTRITDANGVNIDMTYTPRGWLATRIVGGATTTFGYDAMGDVTSINDPSGVTTTFTYDAAHRLTDITDAQGNVIHYTLDAAGNKTAEEIRNASGTVVHSLSRTYNALGQLTAIIDGLNHTVFNASYADSYDANGNLVHSADALGIQQQRGFDALNRLNTTIANYNGIDPATQNTQVAFDHDALDRVDGVADPSGLDTVYTYDGLGNRTELTSPDTGTSTDTYDAAGNRLVHTDANGVVSMSTYDALNRLTSTSYVDTSQNVSYAYDEVNTVTGCTSSKPKGRLTRVIEAGVTTTYCYSSRGKILQKRQITASKTNTTTYTYTVADRLSKVTTPDNTVVTYAYNTNGLPSSVTVTPSGATSASPTVVSAITWLPFGPISSYKLGNEQTVTRNYDANYRVTDLISPALTLHFARDAMGNIVALGNAHGSNPATETYGYDPLYRLTGITDAGTALESYAYNPTGDRLSKTAPGFATGAYLYTAGTHQLANIGNAPRANDANGNTTGSVIGGETFGFGYSGRNRLTVVQRNGQTVGTYSYNAMGERIGKVATFPQAMTERYAYNEVGQLIGEYGTTNRDYIWLGDIPVAVIDNTINGSVTTSTVSYVTADHLSTPRAVTNSAGTVIWQWSYQANPFGEQQPTSTSDYVLNQRYPGQYYDAETGLVSNGMRDCYEPATGRYCQSDPTGLAGGISTYAYALNSPLSYVDPLGLNVTMTCRPLGLVAKLGGTSPKHCGDFVWHWVTDPCTGKKHKVIDSQYSLPGFATAPTTDPNNQTYVDDRNAFNNPGGGNANYNVPPPPGMTQTQFDQSVTSWGNQYSQGEYSLFPGPNSNTAAYDIIFGAGGTPPDVPDAPGNLYYVTPRFPPGYGQ
ncbi:RHS repeat-associated core domain-containing protein [Rhodanobacter sp. Col0626]|uniref:RHS repeat-associated core domain-containing protein n=1 Tax=Rhodanobacter sp. Col0626 TaxID=3415679 RepID=UPI003CF0FC37